MADVLDAEALAKAVAEYRDQAGGRDG
jgi:hypothetical protein